MNYAVKIVAPGRQGGSRIILEGWLIYDPSGELLKFVDAVGRGNAAVAADFPDPVTVLSEVRTTAGYFRGCRFEQYRRDGGRRTRGDYRPA